MRLFIHLHTDMQRIDDRIGAEFTDVASAKAAAIQKGRAAIAGRLSSSHAVLPGWFAEITDAEGELVKLVPMRALLAGSTLDERYRRLYGAAPHPYLMLTPSLIIIDANSAYQHATMTDVEDIRGRHVFDIFPDNPNDPGADGVHKLSRSFDDVVARGEPNAMPRQRYDIRSRNGDWQKRYWDPLNFPVLDDDGDLAFLVHHVTDVTGSITAGSAGVAA